MHKFSCTKSKHFTDSHLTRKSLLQLIALNKFKLSPTSFEFDVIAVMQFALINAKCGREAIGTFEQRRITGKLLDVITAVAFADAGMTA